MVCLLFTEILRIEQDGDLADVEVNPDDDG